MKTRHKWYVFCSDFNAIENTIRYPQYHFGWHLGFMKALFENTK